MPRLLPAVATTVMIVLMADTGFAVQAPGTAAPRHAGPKATPEPRRPARPRGARRPPTRKKTASSPKLSRVQVTLQRDPALAAAVVARLPPSSNLMEVSAGFEDIVQFVAAVNASRTLGIPMREFSRRMVGDRMPLLLAIQDLRPKSHYRTAARRAEDEATAMLAAGEAPALALAKGKG